MNNSLQTLLGQSLLGTEHVERCAIIKRTGREVKASMPIGYQPGDEHVQALQEAFREPAAARTQGMCFDGATYKCVRADKHSLYAKKEESGIVAVRTGSFIVFGTYSSSMHPSVCVEAVERLGEYLREKGK